MYCARCGFRLEEHHYACPVCYPHTRAKSTTFEVVRENVSVPKGPSADVPTRVATAPPKAPAATVTLARSDAAPDKRALPAEAPPQPAARSADPAPARKKDGLRPLAATGLGLVTFFATVVMGVLLLLPMYPALMVNGGRITTHAAAAFVLGLGLVTGGRALWRAPSKRGLNVGMVVGGLLAWLGFGWVMMGVLTSSRFVAGFFATFLIFGLSVTFGLVTLGFALSDRGSARSLVAGLIAAGGFASVLTALQAFAFAPRLQAYADGRATPGAELVAIAVAILAATLVRRQRS